MTDKRPNVFFRFFRAIWRTIDFSRRLILNLLFILVVVLIIVAINEGDEPTATTGKGALVLDLHGKIVEQAHYIEPAQKLVKQVTGGQDEDPEVELPELVKTIKAAATDSNIKALVLQLSDLQPSGLNKLDAVGKAIQTFKASGKPVVAISDWYEQYQYYLASYADTVLMNPQGMVYVQGLGHYRLYFKSLLDKLKVNTHIFRVGTYKSAVEPYMRDSMSDAAKESYQALLDDLWQSYLTGVSERRGLSATQLDNYAKNMADNLKTYNGDMGLMALKEGLVDKLLTREQTRQFITNIVGYDKEDETFNQIDYDSYLSVVEQHQHAPKPGTDEIGIVVAKGVIANGKQPEGEIGGDSTAALLRKARLDKDIKAVVLRVDSPGGSAFASDVIGNEVNELKKAGKPVVVSMSTYAASGGYWISASADKIYAAPTTLTGSIGIFALFSTFEDSLDAIGVHADGLGTTPFAGESLMRPLNEQQASVVQQIINNGYDRFITLVAEARHMSKEDVDHIAQGRVWSGVDAKKLGLVDELGGLDDAVAAAASLAKLDHYDTEYVKRELSEREKLWRSILGEASAALPQGSLAQEPTLQRLLKLLVSESDITQQLNDPNHVYALCAECTL